MVGEMGFFEPKMEKMNRDKMKNLQNTKLRHVVARAYQNVKMYHDKFEKLHPSEIKGVEDLDKIPFTTNNDLKSYSLPERLAVPKIELVRVRKGQKMGLNISKAAENALKDMIERIESGE